jgi:hypothetical protein
MNSVHSEKEVSYGLLSLAEMDTPPEIAQSRRLLRGGILGTAQHTFEAVPSRLDSARALLPGRSCSFPVKRGHNYRISLCCRSKDNTNDALSTCVRYEFPTV